MAAIALVATAAPEPACAAARQPHRFFGSLGTFYRNDRGAAAGRSFRHTYLDRTFELGVGGSLLGPRLGSYSLTGGLGWLGQKGDGPRRDDARQRLDARVQLLPQSPVTFNSFYTGGRSNLPESSFESARADGWGGGVGARLLRGAQSSLDWEKRDERFGGALNTTRSLRAHHGQSVVVGPHQANATWDYLDRDLDAGLAAIRERTRRHTGRADTRLDLGRAGRLGAWFQYDRERAEAVRGLLDSRAMDNVATNLAHEIPLGTAATLTQGFTDQIYRFASAGRPNSLRFQIAEEKLEARRAVGAGSSLRALARAQFNRFERQQDLWLVTALAELEPRRGTGISVAPRAGVNWYSGGLGDGSEAGEVLGVTLRARDGAASLEVTGSRERTKGTGLRNRLDGGGAGYSPRQVGAQLLHTLHVSSAWGRGPVALGADYEFQRVENATLGLDFLTHRMHGSLSWRASRRVSLDAGADYSTADNEGVYFQSDWRSASGTLTATLWPASTLELRSRGSYGRAPSGSREAFWLVDSFAAWHFPMLELGLLHRLERRAPRAGAFDLAREQRLLEFRLTRRFTGAI